MKIYLLFMFLINFLTSWLNAYVYIIVPAHNRPEFIELQFLTFKKFFKDDYRYIIFNDASNSKDLDAINNKCKEFGIDCYVVPPSAHYYRNHRNNDLLKVSYIAPFNHGEVIRYAFEKIGFSHNDIVVLMDSDCFLINKFSVRDYLKNNGLSTRHLKKNHKNAGKSDYAADLTFFNMPLLPNPQSMIVEAGFIGYRFFDPCDLLKFYLLANPSVKFKEMDYFYIKDLSTKSEEELLKLGFSKIESDFIKAYGALKVNPGLLTSTIINKSFISFSSGRFLSPESEIKVKLFKDFISKKLSS